MLAAFRISMIRSIVNILPSSSLMTFGVILPRLHSTVETNDSL
jgi:hypothetical protein